TSFSVSLKDSYGNDATGYTGTLTFSSSDAQASIPPNYTFTPGDAGRHLFNVTFAAAGAQNLTVTDAANPAIKATQAWTVTASAPPPPPPSAPIITAAASANPNPVKAKEFATLSVKASDPNGAALTYKWNFGDRGSGSSAS